MVVFRRAIVILVAGSLSYAGATVAQTGPNEPPGRVGRLAFIQGTVSFHDDEQTDWAPALVNTPVSTGDAIWTEPNARSEISIAGTRLRMDSASQLDMLALDDTQTRMQLDQGRIDIKTFAYDTKQPYEIVTPRGTVSLQQQGDYYIEAGTTEDPTRLGVRQGAAQIQAPSGQVLAVRAGEVGEISGDGSAPQLHTIQTAPPPMSAAWAERDRQVVYDKPPQYLGADVTGYEDLNYYGSWSNDPEYGQVWYARSVPTGWSPYSTGRWDHEQTYGWTWVDEQPWGFAPYHYGRWAQRDNRWFWVPPARGQRAVYAPALVAFVGGTELGAVIGQQNRAPVGWFPLGPREAYVPPYTSNRDYYRRLNASARVQQQVMDDRWQRAQRHDAIADNRQPYALMNRRFATVVPAEDFARSRPVERAAIKVAPDKIAAAPVAFLAAPPSPTQSIRAVRPPDGAGGPNPVSRPNDRRPGEPDAGRNPPDRPTAERRPDAPGAPTRVAPLQAIKPEPEREKAPGPKFVPRATTATHASVPEKPGDPAKNVGPAKGPLPQLAPRNAAAPPAKIEGERRPVQGQQANAPAAPPADANRATPARPGEANLPPARDRNEHRPQPPQPAEAPKAPQVQAVPQAPKPPAPKPVDPPKPPQANTPSPHQAAPPTPPRERETRAVPAAQPRPQAAPPAQQQTHAPSPPPVQHAAPQQQAHAPAPSPQAHRQAAPPPQHAQAPRPAPAPQAPHPVPAPHQAQAPHPAPAPQQQAQAPQHNNEKK